MNIEHSYNYFLVGLSFLVSVFGSYTALQLIRAVRAAGSQGKGAWIMAASFALGGGAIWTMHFIGMLAYDMGMPVSYDAVKTFISLIIAVVVVGIGIWVVGSDDQSLPRLIVAGIITGLGVASMHYTGMAAMNGVAKMTYEPFWFSLSIVIAVVAATAALWMAFHLEGQGKMIAAAIVMGIAVCGMHYTGMYGMIMTHDHSMSVDAGIKPMQLGLMIFCFSMLLLVLSLIAALSQLNRKMYEALEAEDDEDENQEPALQNKGGLGRF
jgi:NO-binding membrane sensor protein with MHYT domain